MQDVHTPSSAGESYEQKELLDLVRRIKDFRARFGYAPKFDDEPGQATSPAKRPAPKTPMNGETLLSREQLARRWGCCIETIKRRERAGSLPSVRFNSRVVRYRLVDIERLEQQATTSRP